MTFIVSVAHFCEVHGPSMIMCTQVVNDPKDLPSFYSPQLPESQFCQSCMFQIPDTEENSPDTSSTITKTTTATTTTTVSSSNGEKSVENNTKIPNEKSTSSSSESAIPNGDISQESISKASSPSNLEDQIFNLLNLSDNKSDHKKRLMTLKTVSKRNKDTFFISTQYPTNTERYASLRQTIVRVFTAETNADLRKPLMFGNSKHGYSMALVFSLSDKTARGSERKYAIIVTSNWEIDLVKNYAFILTNLNQIVKHILISARKVQKEIDLYSGELNNTDVYLRRSAGQPKAKSMVQILQDDKFFVKLHMWASFMLDALEENRHI